MAEGEFGQVSMSAQWGRPAAADGPGWAEMAAARGKESVVPFAALLVFTCILLLAPQSFVPALAHLRIALVAGAIAVAAYCWDRFVLKRPLVRLSREMWITGGLLALAVTTLPLSEWTGGSVKTLLDLYVKALIIFWLLTCTVTTLGRLRVVAWSLSLMAAPLAVTGVRNFLSHPEASRIIGYEAPLTTNPNDLALMLNLILPLTVALFVVNQRAVVRGLLAGLIVLDASAIVVTFSRGGFLALATTLVLYLRTLHRRRQSRWVVAALALVLAALPALPPGYLDRLGTITNIQADQTGSAQVRWEDTWTAFTFALGHPVIGAGLGMNQIGPKSLLGVRVQPVHNVYLEYAVDMGWPGLGLFLLLLVSCISTVTRLCKRCAGLPALQELSALAEAIRIALVAFAVAGLFHPVAYHFYFYYFAGLAIATRTIYESEARFDSGVPASALTR